MSLHVWKAQEKARKLGAYAGNPAAADLWDLSKRELVEAALRLAVAAGADDSAERAAFMVRSEIATLRANGII